MGKLTCQDLMVGDWFKSVDYNSPFRITAIYDDVVQTQADYQSEIDGNWYSEAEIKDLIPIPLTEDILVKNGWRKEPITIDGDYANWYGEIPISQAEDEFNYADIELRYAHQLQHLLRLCGIEKELVID